MLKGKRTYLVAAVMVAYGLFQVASGDVDGGLRTILEGLGFAGLRAGVGAAQT